MVPPSKETATTLLADINKKIKAELEALKTETEKLVCDLKQKVNKNPFVENTIKYLDYLQLVLSECKLMSTSETSSTSAEPTSLWPLRVWPFRSSSSPTIEEAEAKSKLMSFMQRTIDGDGAATTGAVKSATEQLRDLKKLANDRNKPSASLSIRLKSIQMINIMLKKYILSFDVAVLIQELGVHLDKKLQEWLKGWKSKDTLSFPLSNSTSAPISKEGLKNAEIIYRNLQTIKNWYQSLLPADLQSTVQKLNSFAKLTEENAYQNGKTSATAVEKKVIDKNDGKISQTLGEKNKKRAYLVDLVKDASSFTVSIYCRTTTVFS